VHDKIIAIFLALLWGVALQAQHQQAAYTIFKGAKLLKYGVFAYVAGSGAYRLYQGLSLNSDFVKGRL